MLIFLIIFGYLLIGLGIAILYERYSDNGWYDDIDILAAVLFWPAVVVCIVFFGVIIWIVRTAGGRGL